MARHHDDNEDACSIDIRVQANTAVLLRLSEAQQSGNPEMWGAGSELEHDFWRGVEELVRQTRDDAKRLYRIAIEERDPARVVARAARIVAREQAAADKTGRVQ